MRRVSIGLLASIAAVVTLAAQADNTTRLAGAYRLVSDNATGYLFYDPSGLFAVAIQQRGRGRFAAAQPTPEEALAAVTTYAGSFGTYAADVRAGTITHHRQGSFDPNDTGTDQRAAFTMAGNRLMMTTRGRDGAPSSVVWERMPDRPNLTPLERRFLGFRKLVLNEIRNEKGEVLPGASGGVDAGGTAAFPGQTGYIVYTAAGAMMVHMMQPNRPKYAGARPTGAEAQEIIHTYNTYFGTWEVNERDGVVVHKREASFKPNTIDDVPRKFVFEGRRLTLMPPPTMRDGVAVRQGYLGWELPAANTTRE